MQDERKYLMTSVNCAFTGAMKTIMSSCLLTGSNVLNRRTIAQVMARDYE